MNNRNHEVTLWKSNQPAEIYNSNSEVAPIINRAIRLTAREQQQIISAFNASSFEMVSEFVWNKSLRSLKKELGKLGLSFIAEMVGREEVGEYSNVDEVLTDFEALRLAEDLGLVNKTGAFRLKQSLELVHHFSSLDENEKEDEYLEAQEAYGIIKSCVKNILAIQKAEDGAISDFVAFRNKLKSTVLNELSPEILTLKEAQYFFQRTTIKVLMSEIKSTESTHLEIILSNSSIIIPAIWSKIAEQEKFLIGKAYSEVVADGKKVASSGLRNVLLKVNGFDFVPEDLRSKSFIRAAAELIKTHEGSNNFYLEGSPAKILSSMGSIIPGPAFPICMTAILCSKLGNAWGHCWGSQDYLDNILIDIPKDRWEYYLSKCLQTDDRVLYKLQNNTPIQRFQSLINKYNLASLEITNVDIKNLLEQLNGGDIARSKSIVSKLIDKLGYAHN